MVRMYFLTMYLILGCLLMNAQNPCTDFNDPVNPAGNWNPSPPPNGNVNVSFSSANPVDGSQYLVLRDKSGGSWYENKEFYKLGQRFLGQCIYFDFYLENDSGYGMPYHPNITISDGVNTATFVASGTVTPGSGWVRLKAPIEHCSGSFPSNSDGAWTMAPGMTCTDFNNVLDNCIAIMITPDMTSTQQEVVYFDNICVKECNDCNKCNSNFKLQTTTSTSGNFTIAQVFLESTNSPALYKVDWGDGTVTNVLTSHVYTSPGSYKVCVTQYENDKPKCTTCIELCIPKPFQIGKNENSSSFLTSPVKDIEAIGKAELSSINETKDYFLVPNPAKNYVEVQTNLAKKGLISVKIIDMSGKTVLEKSETYNSGKQTVNLKTDQLPGGTYIVEINSNGKINSDKLIISR